jgi:hypothetical protein
MHSLMDVFPQSVHSWSRLPLLPNLGTLFCSCSEYCLCACLESDIKLTWSEMPLEVMLAQNSGSPKNCGM